MWVPFALYDECSWHSPFILVILVNVVIVDFLSVLSLLFSLLSCLVILLDGGYVAVVVAAADE